MRILKPILFVLFTITALGLRGQEFGEIEAIYGNSLLIHGSVLDSINNVYITGAFRGTVDFDLGQSTFNLTAGNGGDAFFAKYDSSLNLIWCKQIAGPNIVETQDIYLDHSGNILITGGFLTSVDCDPDSLNSFILTTSNTDAFISKYTNSGDFIWAKQIRGNQYERLTEIKCNSNNEIFVTGSFQDQTDLDPGPGSVWVTSTKPFGAFNHTHDAFLLKLDSNGNYIWHNLIHRNSSIIGKSVEIDASGDIYYSGLEFIRKVNPNGSNGWTSYTNRAIESIKISPSGNLISVENDVNASFINVRDQNGSILPTISGVLSGNNAIGEVAINSIGEIFVTGTFRATTDFNPKSSSYSLSPIGTSDLYLIKLDQNANLKWINRSNGAGQFFHNTGISGGYLFERIPKVSIGENNKVFLAASFSGQEVLDTENGPFNTSQPAGGIIGFISQKTIDYLDIDSISSIAGTVNSDISIIGHGFDQGSAPSVRFGAVKSTVNSFNDSVINVNVPIGATFDPISVETDSGIAYSNEKFSTTFSGAKGISQNSFDLPQILSTGDQPHYVTTLDIDGDGKTDLITPNQGDNNISVFRNIGTAGNPSFAARVNFATGTLPREVAYGDIDLDGKPDLVVANLGANTISVFKNTSTPGTISFASKVDFPVVSAPAYVQIRDFDGDGKADVAVANFNSNSISLYQNVATQGVIDGTSLVSGGTLSTATNPHRIQAEDVDSDGKLDLVVANSGSGTVYVYRNISTPGVFNSGSFDSAPASISIGTLPNGLSLGDLNGNGFPDIACAASTAGNLIIRENQSSPGNIAFGNAVSFPIISGESEVEIVDADGDGHLDVALGFLNTGKVTFFENSGNGGTINSSSFKTPVDVYGLPCVDLEFADLDGDSLPELIVPHVSSDQLSIYRRLLNPPAPPKITSFFPESGNVNSIVTIRGENFDTNPALNKVFFGNMEATIIGGVADTSLQVLVPVGADREPITVGNINGSAQSSKAFNTTFDGAESIYPGAFTKIPDISVGTGNPMGIDAGDLNMDGKADLVLNKYNANQITVLINTGSAGAPAFQSFNYNTNAKPRGLVIADVDVDGRLDILVANRDANNISIFPNAFSGGAWNASSLATKVDIAVGATPHFIEVADLDNDGKPELIVTNFNGNNISILKNYSEPGNLSISSFPYQIFKNTGTNPLRVKADDIDLDGKIDLIVGNYGSNTATVYHNTSPQGVIHPEYITAAVDLVVGNLTRGIAVGDLDGDGKPDIGVNTDGSQAAVIFKNQTSPGIINSSSFSSGTSFNSGVFPLDIAFSDLDGNGKLDIATCNYGNDFVRILNNVGSGSGISTSTFQLTITLPTGTNPHGLAAIDIDGDSLTDLITPNYNGNSISVFLRNPNPPSPPRIDSLNPQSGPIASVVKVHGEHFNDTAANNTVWFGSTEGTVLNATESELDVEVPLGARFLPLTVTNSNGTGASNNPFITTYDRALGINSSSFEPRIDVPTGGTTVYNAVGDLDGDGKSDIVQVPVGGSNIFVFRNTTTGAIPTFATKFNLTALANPHDVDLVDVDMDGKLDIVIININTGSVNVFRNTYSGGSFGPSSFTAPASISLGGTTNYVEMRDLDFDGKPDIVATRTDGGLAMFRKNESVPGIIAFGTSFALNTGGAFSLGLSITDLNGDHKPEIIVGNNGSTFLSVFENKGTFNNPRASSFNLLNFGIGSAGSHGVASGDLDGDGDPDIGVVVGASVRIFKNNSISGQALNGSSLATYITLPLNASSTRLEFTDMDGDGILDIVAANHVGGNSVSVIKNNSTPSSMTPGDFETPIILSTGPSSAPHFMSVADINNDSLPDIITSNNLNNFMSIFLRKLNPCQDPTLPVFTSSVDSICAGDSTWISVDAGSLNDASAWYWYSGSCGGTLVGIGDSILVSPATNATYFVRGEGGCVTPGACVARNVVVGNTGGGISASVDNQVICQGENVTLTASGSPNIQWNGGIVNGQPTRFNEPGSYIYYVTGEDAFGCSSRDSAFFFVAQEYADPYTGTFPGSDFENFIPLYFPCDTAGLDSSLYNFNVPWVSFFDLIGFAFAPFFGTGCPQVTSINQSFDAYSGISALRMDADTNGFAQASANGALAGKPNKLQGYFKTDAGPNDTIAVLVGAVETGLSANSQDSSNYVGYGEFVTTGSTGTYTQFEIPINYSGMSASDSFEISLVFVNSATSGGVKSVWFDAFNFVYDTALVSICAGDSAFLGGAWQTTAGLYTDNFTTAFGCDSVVTVNLEIINSSSGSETTSACDTYTWPTNGQTYTTSGIQTAILTNAAGCDSVVTLDLTITNSSSGTDVITACDSYLWIDGNTYTASNNSATFTLTNAVGCDSVVTLDLTITNSNSGTDIVTACDSYTWIDGNTYTSNNNTATFTLTNAAGCDSVVTLDLTITNSNSGTDVVTACDSYTWIDGNTYTSNNNTATFTLTNAAGCDSVVTLDLTITNSNTGIDVVTACDSYTWIDGNTYTSNNNTATFTLTNAAGCDSVVTLDLTINNSSTGSETVTACDSYTWPANGQTYTASGTPTATLTNAAGCDSIVTLNLTITNSNSGTDVITACDSYTWIDGNTYTSSNNTASFTLTNAAGCDSVVTLDLTINNSNSGTDVVTACDSYQWIDGNTYTSNNNTATFTLTNASGCDSVITLNLTINNSTTGSETITACDSYIWAANGQTYNASGTHTATLTNAAGCDSVVTLNLTINNSATSSFSEDICSGETYIFGTQTLNSAGTYTEVFTGPNGCDSTVTLTLNVTTVDTSVTVSNNTLTANTSGATYQWIDCDNGNVPIPGETNQTFTATQSGNYAVVVTENNCSDTSGCFNVNVVGLKVSTGSEITFYPNPTSGKVIIEMEESHKATISILDQKGVILKTFEMNERQMEINLGDLPSAKYFIRIQGDGIDLKKGIIKN